MKIAYLANNKTGLETARFLATQDVQIGALIVHGEANSAFRDEIIAASGCSKAQVFDADSITDPGVIQAIKNLQCDIGVSVLFGHILSPEFISLFRLGIVNVHPSFLPYNRGEYPNVWSIIDGTPAGATIHYIDQGIDTGKIIAQEQIEVLPQDTGLTLYRRLETLMLELFTRTWPLIVHGPTPCQEQPSKGTYHRRNDVDSVDELDLAAVMPTQRVIDTIRARTFPPYRGAYYSVEGKKYYLRLTIIPEDEHE